VTSTCTQTSQVTADQKQHLVFTGDSKDPSSPEGTTVLPASRDKGGPPHLPSSPSVHSSNPCSYVRAAEPRNPGRDVQEGKQRFWATVAPPLPPAPLPCSIPPGSPFLPPLVPDSRPAGRTRLQRFSEQLSHLPAETASRGAPSPVKQMWLIFVQHLCPVPLFILNGLAFAGEGLARGCFGGGHRSPSLRAPHNNRLETPGFPLVRNNRLRSPRHSGLDSAAPQRFGSSRGEWLTLAIPVGVPNLGK